MELSDQQRKDLAAAIVAAEDNNVPMTPVSTTYPDADVEDAYRNG